VATLILLPDAFDGMAQDFPRNNMPKGKAWNLVDYISQQLGSGLTERGGWEYASASLTAVSASATYVEAAVYAPFTAGGQLLVITDNAKLIKEVSGTNTAISGTANKPLQNPFFHASSGLVVIPSPDGSTAAQSYDATSLTALGSTAPPAPYGTVWVNYTWLGGTSAEPQRAYASAVGDPTTYVQTGVDSSYWDFSFPIKGMAALPNVLLVFGDDLTARLRGTTPPPGTDIQADDPVFNIGCVDARSIATNGAFAVWVNAQGVWITNGTAFPENLAKTCGILRYWIHMMSVYTPSWTIAGDWFGDNYVCSVMNGSTFVDAFVFDTKMRQVNRISNLKSMAFAKAGAAGQELYAGSRATPRIMQLSTMWTPSATFKNDGDGTAVAGVWETPFYDTQKFGTERWKNAYLDYDIRDAASDNPTFTVSYCTSPETGAAYTALSPTYTETTMREARRRPIHRKSRGMGFKVTRTNASALARIYGIGADVYGREGSRQDV
jgi:hypothetical protein